MFWWQCSACTSGTVELQACSESAEFVSFLCRFTKEIRRLATALHIPVEYTLPQRSKVSGFVAFLVLLRRLAYPNRLGDLVPQFGFPISRLSFTISLFPSTPVGSNSPVPAGWIRPDRWGWRCANRSILTQSFFLHLRIRISSKILGSECDLMLKKKFFFF